MILLCRCAEHPAPLQPDRSRVELPKGAVLSGCTKLYQVFGKTKLHMITGQFCFLYKDYAVVRQFRRAVLGGTRRERKQDEHNGISAVRRTESEKHEHFSAPAGFVASTVKRFENAPGSSVFLINSLLTFFITPGAKSTSRCGITSRCRKSN